MWEEDVDHHVLALGRHSETQALEVEQERRKKELKGASSPPASASFQARGARAQKQPPPSAAKCSSAPHANSWYRFAAWQGRVQGAGTDGKRVLVSQGEDLRVLGADKGVLRGVSAEDRGVSRGVFELGGEFGAENGALRGGLGEDERVLRVWGSVSAEDRGWPPLVCEDSEGAESSAWSSAGSPCDGVVVPGSVGSVAACGECGSGGTLCVCICVCVCVCVCVSVCVVVCDV